MRNTSELFDCFFFFLSAAHSMKMITWEQYKGLGNYPSLLSGGVMSFKRPTRKCDCKLCFQDIFWCEFWWEEKVMLSNAGRLYDFNSDLKFYYEDFEFVIHKEIMLVIKEAYAKWLLEKEILG